MTADWFMQLVDSSAFEQPNEIRAAIRSWLEDDGRMIERQLKWDDDAPYPSTITFSGVALYLPVFTNLLDELQEHLGETEYMVFTWLGNSQIFEQPIEMYVVTKTLIATMSGRAMVQELVKQLHAAAAPATGDC